MKKRRSPRPEAEKHLAASPPQDWLDPSWETWWGSKGWRERLQAALRAAQQRMEALRYDEALEALGPWLTPSSSYLEALVWMANLLSQRGECEEAEVLYRFVLFWKPKDPFATAEYTLFLLEHGQSREAAMLCCEALEEYPDSSDLWEALGRILLEQERFQEALEALKEAQRLEPSWGEIYALQAFCYSSLAQEEKAYRAWRKALMLAPENLSLRWQYGLWLYEQGRIEEALPYLLEVLEIQPQTVGTEGIYFVAECYRTLGRFEEARNLLRSFGLDEDE